MKQTQYCLLALHGRAAGHCSSKLELLLYAFALKMLDHPEHDVFISLENLTCSIIYVSNGPVTLGRINRTDLKNERYPSVFVIARFLFCFCPANTRHARLCQKFVLSCIGLEFVRYSYLLYPTYLRCRCPMMSFTQSDQV